VTESYTWRELARSLLISAGAGRSNVDAIGDWMNSSFPDIATFAVPAGVPHFDYEPLEYIASVMLDVFRQSIDLLPATGQLADQKSGGVDESSDTADEVRSTLMSARARVQAIRRAILLLRDADSDYWSANLRLGPQPPATFQLLHTHGASSAKQRAACHPMSV